MPESTRRQLMDKCYRVYAAYRDIRPYLPPSIKAYYLMSRWAYNELDRASYDLHDYDYQCQQLYGIPIKVDISENARDVLLMMEVIDD